MKTMTAQEAIQKIFHAHGLADSSSPSEQAQTAALLSEPGLEDESLRDLRDVPFVTIDNEHSRDLDQALHLTTRDSGYVFRYALADAAFYIRPGTPLFARALERGASFYVADRAAPMLPRELSEGLISLNAQVDRRAIVFETTLSETAEVLSTAVYAAVIHSQAKLSYRGVQEFLDAPETHAYASEPYAASLLLLPVVGGALMENAHRRHVIQFNRDEAQIHTTQDGEFKVSVRERFAVERYNEQLSLLCNTEGARMLKESGYFLGDELHSVFRVHAAPTESRILDMKDTVGEIVAAHDLPDSWAWDGKQKLADYVAGLPAGDGNRRRRQAIERQIQRTNNASEYSDQAAPHYALAVDSYARFSSPMREVVGIFTHKELLEAIGLYSPDPENDDAALQEQIIEAGNRSRSLQKRLNKEVAFEVIRRHTEESLALPTPERPRSTGTIVGMRASRMYVVLDVMPIEVKVYAGDLSAEHDTEYRVDGARFVPRDHDRPVFCVGDTVSAMVSSWDKERRRAVISLQVITPE